MPTAIKYMQHDWLPLAFNVAQCKRCGVFMQEGYDANFTTTWIEQDGVELANEPKCVTNEAY